MLLLLLPPLLESRVSICSPPRRSASFPFCDPSLPEAQRIASLVGSLTLSEKASLLGNSAEGVDRLGLPGYEWWNEGLHGLGPSPGVHFTPKTPSATQFPCPLNLASSFDLSLISSVASTISDEGRAFFNSGSAGLTFWAPNVNLFRDPRWGRGYETSGEDPFLTRMYAKSFIPSFQGETKGRSRLKASACCKHFYDYNLENYANVTRMTFDAWPSAQDDSDSYLPMFESCVSAGVSCLMCSYNSVRGVPNCANRALLTLLAKQKWGFQGYITGDCDAIENILRTHNFTNSEEETVRVALEAGANLDCGGLFQGFAQKAVSEKTVHEGLLDEALKNLFAVQFRLGLFDREDPFSHLSFGRDGPGNLDHMGLALETAKRSIVLLDNKVQGKLPFYLTLEERGKQGLSEKANRSKEKVVRIAVVGPHSKSRKEILGNYYGVPPYVRTIWEGVSQVSKEIAEEAGVKVELLFEAGCSNLSDCPPSEIKKAVEASRNSEFTILSLGLSQEFEAETKDRPDLNLPQGQVDLAKAVCEDRDSRALGKAVVLVSGGPVVTSTLSLASSACSFVWAGYPGQEGGRAIAEIVFGISPPSGRVPISWPVSDFSEEDMRVNLMRPVKKKGGGGLWISRGRTYRFYEGQKAFPFGFGLFYSDWKYFNMQAKVQGVPSALKQMREGEVAISLEVVCTDSGKKSFCGSSSHSVLVFAVPPQLEDEGHPKKLLVGFSLVKGNPRNLEVRGTQNAYRFDVSLSISLAEFRVASRNGSLEPLGGKWGLEAGCAGGEEVSCARTSIHLFEITSGHEEVQFE